MSSAYRRSPPALVLGGPWITALCVIRNLGRKGIRQFAIGTAGSFVEACRWHRRLPTSRESTPDELPTLLTALSPERMVLFPCSDEWTLAASNLEPSLAARFPAIVASRDTVETLIDKGRFARVLERLTLPHPRTTCIASSDDLDALPDQVFQHAFIKPRHSMAFSARYGVKALSFTTRTEAKRRLTDVWQAGHEVVLQEYIPGPPTRHYMLEGFVDRSGRIAGWCVRHRLRMYPEDYGDSSWMVTVPLREVASAAETLTRLFSALRYRGVFEAEFKYDDRDGVFKLLEVNSRPWSFVGFAARCGVDVCEMAYRDAIGLPLIPVTTYAVRRHCVQYAVDGLVCWKLFREGRLRFWDWMKSWLISSPLIFSLDDPAPALVRIGTGLWRRLGAFAARLTR
jgi:predicted ATP-grasp superfamily ATP-dependent carboligase